MWISIFLTWISICSIDFIWLIVLKFILKADLNVSLICSRCSAFHGFRYVFTPSQKPYIAFWSFRIIGPSNSITHDFSCWIANVIECFCIIVDYLCLFLSIHFQPVNFFTLFSVVGSQLYCERETVVEDPRTLAAGRSHSRRRGQNSRAERGTVFLQPRQIRVSDGPPGAQRTAVLSSCNGQHWNDNAHHLYANGRTGLSKLRSAFPPFTVC